jgi:predicted RNA-binding Zn ribbon-like protein
MTTALKKAGYIKKLEWAISLSQKNLQDLREGDWLNLQEELYEFVCDPDPKAPADYQKKIFFKKATLGSIEAIQRELRTRFDQCVEMCGTWKKEGLSAVFGINFDVTKAKVHLIAGTPDFLFQQRVSCEDLKTEVLLELANVLVVSGVMISQIRRCPNPDCVRLFLMRMKPRADRNFYCSRRCSGLAATRKYRGKRTEDLRAKDRDRYEKKQKQRLGVRTKVGRKSGHA